MTGRAFVQTYYPLRKGESMAQPDPDTAVGAAMTAHPLPLSERLEGWASDIEKMRPKIVSGKNLAERVRWGEDGAPE